MNTNVDTENLSQFSELAEKWWDPKGPMKPLHQLNPLRTAFIQSHLNMPTGKILDIGCGGGLLTEALAKKSYALHGIDRSETLIHTAHHHAQGQSLSIEYTCISAEEFAEKYPRTFDAVTCMELLEHVPNPPAIIQACHRLVKPGGCIFFSTLNRTWQSFFTAIVGAEYILGLLPKGTHAYAQFIRPSELTAWCRAEGLNLEALQGVRYHLLKDEFGLDSDVSVNYMACFKQ